MGKHRVDPMAHDLGEVGVVYARATEERDETVPALMRADVDT